MPFPCPGRLALNTIAVSGGGDGVGTYMPRGAAAQRKRSRFQQLALLLINGLLGRQKPCEMVLVRPSRSGSESRRGVAGTMNYTLEISKVAMMGYSNIYLR